MLAVWSIEGREVARLPFDSVLMRESRPHIVARHAAWVWGRVARGQVAIYDEAGKHLGTWAPKSPGTCNLVKVR